MNFLGMGPMELMLILVLALIVFGPGKLPEIAGQVGKAVRDMRRATSDLSGEFNRTLSLELEEKKDAERQAAVAPTAAAASATPTAAAIPTAGEASIASAEPAVVVPPAVGEAVLPPAAVGSEPLSGTISAAPVAASQLGQSVEPPASPVQHPLTVSASDLADAPPTTSAPEGPATETTAATPSLAPAAPVPPTPVAEAAPRSEPPLADTSDWHWEEPWTPGPAQVQPATPIQQAAATEPALETDRARADRATAERPTNERPPPA